MKHKHHIKAKAILLVQLLFIGAFGAAWAALSPTQRQQMQAEIRGVPPLTDVPFVNRNPAVVTPLYDEPQVVSDEQLLQVLTKVLPHFSRERLKPNFVEHALRIWGSEVTFDDPQVLSGPEMTEFLLDSGRYAASWGDAATPVLEANDGGVHVRWGIDTTTSVHHDHMLACLAEAGVGLDRPVFTTARRTNLQQILSEALRDFRPDERETEWSVMGFVLYLMPQQTTSWHNSEGRRITLDMLADRLMRGHRKKGVCLGTHRIYSLMAMLRLDDEFGGSQTLSPATRSSILHFLSGARDLMIASQEADGSWPPNWYDGDRAAEKSDPSEPFYRRVIATGHHLEWLAIAPRELHPPQDVIRRAAEWMIRNTLETSQDVIAANYTYYSHAGNALALWRGTSPSEFWKKSHEVSANPSGQSD